MKKKKQPQIKCTLITIIIYSIILSQYSTLCQSAGLLVVPRVWKSAMIGKAFSYRLLSCGTRFHFRSSRQKTVLFLRLDYSSSSLKLIFS